MRNTVETRKNKHEERRGVEVRIQEDDPNADQKEKEREDHVAHQDQSGSRGHLHRVHPRVQQKPVHRPEHPCAVVQVHQQQHEVLVFEQPGAPSVRQTQRQRSGFGGVSKHRRKHDGALQRPLEIRRRPRQQTGVWTRQRERTKARVEGRLRKQGHQDGRIPRPNHRQHGRQNENTSWQDPR